MRVGVSYMNIVRLEGLIKESQNGIADTVEPWKSRHRAVAVRTCEASERG